MVVARIRDGSLPEMYLLVEGRKICEEMTESESHACTKVFNHVGVLKTNRFYSSPKRAETRSRE